MDGQAPNPTYKTHVNFPLKAEEILEGFSLSRHWHVMDLHTQIPPCAKGRSSKCLVNHQKMFNVFIITYLDAAS